MVIHRRAPAAAVLVGVLAAAPAAQQTQERSLERSFGQGGTVDLDLSAGQYRITGSPDDRIRIEWDTRPGDEDDVAVRIDVNGPRARVDIDGPDNDFRVSIALPQRSNLILDLSAGELHVRGIEGSKDVSARAGDINIAVGDPSQYRRVDASVRIGGLTARPFRVDKGGFFRSFEWTGNGPYDLHASLTVGQLSLVD